MGVQVTGPWLYREEEGRGKCLASQSGAHAACPSSRRPGFFCFIARSSTVLSGFPVEGLAADCPLSRHKGFADFLMSLFLGTCLCSGCQDA